MKLKQIELPTLEVNSPDNAMIDTTKVANKSADSNYSVQNISELERLENLRKKISSSIRRLSFAENEKHADRVVRVVGEMNRACNEQETRIIDNGSGIYIFVETHYQRVDKKNLFIYIAQQSVKMGVNPTTAERAQFIEDIGKQVSYSCYHPFDTGSRNSTIINLVNGELHITNGNKELKPHSIESYMTYVLPFEYDPEAKCPMFDKFIGEVLPDENTQKVMQEYIGYLLTTNLKLEKFLLLYGTGANGKSVLLEVVSALFGEENVTNFSLENLTKSSGQYTMQIAGKIVNICSDISTKIEDTGILKLMASGEPLEARQLYKDPIIIYNYAKLLFSLNKLPVVTDHTNGYFRRFLIIPFSAQIPIERQDKGLSKKIIQSELAGVLNWALAGLDRLMEQQAFTDAEDVAKQLQEFRTSSDSVALFFSENHWKASECSKVLLKDFYAQYIGYCSESGYHSVGKRVLQERLQGMGVTVKMGTGGKIYAWVENFVPEISDLDEEKSIPF